eukprot:1922604-Prymnesium_polylepis.1
MAHCGRDVRRKGPGCARGCRWGGDARVGSASGSKRGRHEGCGGARCAHGRPGATARCSGRGGRGDMLSWAVFTQGRSSWVVGKHGIQRRHFAM